MTQQNQLNDQVILWEKTLLNMGRGFFFFFSRSLLDWDILEGKNSDSFLLASPGSVISQLLNCLSFPNVADNRLAWRNTDRNENKHILSLPGQVITLTLNGLDLHQKKSYVLVEVHVLITSCPMPPPRHCSCNYPFALLQSSPIQWIIAISSEMISHLYKILDPNTLTPIAIFLLSCKTKLI